MRIIKDLAPIILLLLLGILFAVWGITRPEPPIREVVIDEPEDKVLFKDPGGSVMVIQQAPATALVIGDNIGRMSWMTGELVFEGKADESAKIFFEFLKPYVDSYIQANKDKP